MGVTGKQLLFAAILLVSCLPETFGQWQNRTRRWYPQTAPPQGQYCPPQAVPHQYRVVPHQYRSVPHQYQPMPHQHQQVPPGGLMLPPSSTDNSDSAARPENTNPSSNPEAPESPPTPNGNTQSENPAQPQQSLQDQFNDLSQGQQQNQNQPAQNQPSQNLRADVGLGGGDAAPNMIGDFIGFTTGSFLQRSSFEQFTRSLTFNNVSQTTNGSGQNVITLDGNLTLPNPDSSQSPIALGQAVSLTLDGSGQVVGISDSDRNALNNFLSRGGSGLDGRSGSLSVDDITITTGQPGGTTDAIVSGLASPGGIAPGSVIALNPTGVHISRYKASEQTSPIPRDRFLFNASWFENVSGPGGSQDVQRFVPGFEHMVSDNSSVEIRLPFASTFDNFQPGNEDNVFAGASDTEFGNIVATYKELLYQSDHFAFSVGGSIELPTSEDLVFENSLLRVTRESESVYLSPFIGMLVTNGRFFAQSFVQLSFDTNGETVTVEDRLFNSVDIGRLQDATALFADFSGGYWFYRNEHPTKATQLTGLAGMMEIHLNQTVQDLDSMTTAQLGGNTYTFGNDGGSLGVANMTFGTTLEFGKQSTMTFAYVKPLTDTDRQFDGEFRVLFSYYPDRLGSSTRNPRL